ncbi:F0F1 ATP synthase subunit I [Enterobacteriaceae bacterium LUAb1]
MSVPFISMKLVYRILLFQLTVLLVISLLFVFRDTSWGLSAVMGGMAVWLPNAIFMIFAWGHQAQTSLKGRVAWGFVIGEALKVFATIVLLIVALGWLKAEFIPLAISWLSVLVVQIVAPTVINIKG